MDKFKEIEKKIKKFDSIPNKHKPIYSSPSSASITIEFTAQIGVGIFLGYKLDQFFNTRPWFLLILLILSLISSLYSMYKKYK